MKRSEWLILAAVVGVIYLIAHPKATRNLLGVQLPSHGGTVDVVRGQLTSQVDYVPAPNAPADESSTRTIQRGIVEGDCCHAGDPVDLSGDDTDALLSWATSL